MQKHAMALGYFFLAVFSVFTASQGVPMPYHTLLLLAALCAALMGLGFLVSACAPRISAGGRWLVQLARQAEQPPEHPAAPRTARPV